MKKTRVQKSHATVPLIVPVPDYVSICIGYMIRGKADYAWLEHADYSGMHGKECSQRKMGQRR